MLKEGHQVQRKISRAADKHQHVMFWVRVVVNFSVVTWSVSYYLLSIQSLLSKAISWQVWQEEEASVTQVEVPPAVYSLVSQLVLDNETHLCAEVLIVFEKGLD